MVKSVVYQDRKPGLTGNLRTWLPRPGRCGRSGVLVVSRRQKVDQVYM